jgi:hypothetical protein
MGTAVIALTGQTVPDAIVVVAMVAAEIFLLTRILPREGPPPTLARMVILTSSLLASAGFLMALTGAFVQSNLNNYTVVLLMFNTMMVVPVGLWMVAVVILQDRRVDPSGLFWPLLVSGLATFAEVLMGVFFTVAAAPSLDPIDVTAGTLSSAWYLWSMAGAMFALLWWVRIPRLPRVALAGLTAAAVAAPWVAAEPLVGAGLMTGLMVLSLLAILREAARPGAAPAAGGTVAAVAAAFAAMSGAGVAVALAPGTTTLLAFGGVMTAIMLAEFTYLVHLGLRGDRPVLKLPRPELEGPPIGVAPAAGDAAR